MNVAKQEIKVLQEKLAMQLIHRNYPLNMQHIITRVFRNYQMEIIRTNLVSQLFTSERGISKCDQILENRPSMHHSTLQLKTVGKTHKLQKNYASFYCLAGW